MKKITTVTLFCVISLGFMAPLFSGEDSCDCCGDNMACCNLRQNISCNDKSELKCSPLTLLPVGPKPVSIKVNNFTIVENVLSAEYSVISKDDISVTDFIYSLPPPKIPLYLKSHSFLI
jgi:hypothetical protein